jgi:hypothetical protein
VHALEEEKQRLTEFKASTMAKLEKLEGDQQKWRKGNMPCVKF